MINIGDIMFLHEWEDARDMEVERCDCGQSDCEECNIGDLLAEAHVEETKIERGEDKCP